MSDVSLGILGKHPGYGDFLRHGVRRSTAEGLSFWLDRALTDLKSKMDAEWPTYWDNAISLRFWIGPEVFGQTIAGILRPSQDKVGRRYPLLLMTEGAYVHPPVSDPDQTLYETFEAHLDAAQPGQGAAALLDGLTVELQPEPSEKIGASIWAHHPEGDLGSLLGAALMADHQRASLGRVHFWSPGGPNHAATWLSGQGLPGAESFGWLLSGVPREAQVAEQAPETALAEETNADD